jgi:phage terminase small subunit
MLGVLNDPGAAPNRKDRMAIAAAPYVHPRVAEVGKKATQAEAARNAGGDDVWGDDLQVDGGLVRQ